jgi:hypothetical protein
MDSTRLFISGFKMRALRIGYICICAVVMLAPGLQTAFSLIDITPLDERRQLGPAPDIIGILLYGDGRLGRGINLWFDDHVGFRPWLVRLSNELDYRIFKYSNKVLVGENGWLYDPGFLADRVDAERKGEAQARPFREKLLAIANYLARREIRLVVVSNPMKATIYPQFLPASAPRFPRFNEFQKLRAFLGQQPNWIYIDGQDVLEHCGSGYDHFLRTDHHLTEPAELCFPREVVGRIAIAEGRGMSPWHERFEFPAYPWGGGALARFLAIFVPPEEISYHPQGLFDSVPPPEGRFEEKPSPPFELVYHTDPTYRADKFPQIVLFGNSFVDLYLPGGMINYFTDVYRIRGNGEQLSEALRTIPAGTRYFVLQFLEPYIASMLATSVPPD